MTSFISAIYNVIPNITQTNSIKTIKPVGGSNPVDSVPVTLQNIRGQIRISVTSKDNNFTSAFNVVGGFGEFRTSPTQNFYANLNSAINCTIDNSTLNQVVITTPAADAGGREYTFIFIPYQAFPPSIERTGGAVIGNNDLDVELTYYQVAPV